MRNYKDILKSDIVSQDYEFLIVSTTQVETEAFHAVMRDEIMRVVVGDYTYYLGLVGQYNVISVQCLQMGSLNPGGSAQTINAALHEWPQLKAVIMTGICFGVDSEKQQIGDVIVSSAIKNYETRRIGEKKEIPRGGTYQLDKCLFNAFNNLKLSWENIGIDGKKKNLTLGLYLSGEQLVDNKEVRDAHLAETPEAKAGEMEGNGLVAACESARIPWVLVKAICDFADGEKGKDKEQRQRIAAASSAHCCEAALEQMTAFEGLGIHRVNNNADIVKNDRPEVLFELYKKEFEPYFLKREIDQTVEQYLSCHSLWIYGVSGVGKSTSISHALLSKGRKVLLINMAGIPSKCSLEEVFEWIYNEIAYFVGETSLPPNSYQLCIKSIIRLLDNHFAGTPVYVLVEELPFTGDVFKEFVCSFSSLVVSDKLTGASADVHFVLSSIENPLQYVTQPLQKIKSMMRFLEFELWSDQECNSLIDLIRKHLTVPAVKDRADMIAKCGNLPRPIKSIFREVYQTGHTGELDTQTINKLLSRF